MFSVEPLVQHLSDTISRGLKISASDSQRYFVKGIGIFINSRDNEFEIHSISKRIPISAAAEEGRDSDAELYQRLT